MKTKTKLASFFDAVLEKVFPPNFKCVFCARELDKQTKVSTCNKCLETLPFTNGHKMCVRCSNQIEGRGKYCLVCKSTKRHFDKAISPFFYIDEIRAVVHKFKYNNEKYLFYPMASFMAKRYYEALGKDFSYIDLIIPVPMHPSSEKKRGYNQAALLAEKVGEIIGIEVDCDNLIKSTITEKQVGLEFKDRQKNIENSFSVVQPKFVKDKVVMLVDDVFTSGATASECARILKKNGAKKVIVLTLARTHFQKN